MSCTCGCGEETNPGKKYVFGHAHRPKAWRWKREDRGHTTKCWVWQGSLSGGYGRIHHGGRRTGVHRAFYEMLVGPVEAGLELDHLCRVRACVNPDHLEPVTLTENQRRSPYRKLCLDDANEIRRLRAETGVSYGRLAARFGVSDQLIFRICQDAIWC